MNYKLNKKYINQLDDYEFECFITEILKYHILYNYKVKSCECSLLTPKLGDKEIDCILKVIDENNHCKFVIVQITKDKKSHSQLERFFSDNELEFYKNIDKDFMSSAKERLIVSIEKSYPNKDVHVIDSENLTNIIELIGDKFGFINNKGLLKQEFIEFISSKTYYWNRANRIRKSRLDYEQFKAIQEYNNCYITDLSQWKKYQINIKMKQYERKNSYERRCIHYNIIKSSLGSRIETSLDEIHYNSADQLTSRDFDNLYKLLEKIFNIVDKLNEKQNINYKLDVEFKSKYICVKKVNRYLKGEFQVVGYFNYCFSRGKESYKFNFLSANTILIEELKNKGMHIISKGKKISDSCNFRGNVYLEKPDIENVFIDEALEKLLKDSIYASKVV